MIIAIDGYEANIKGRVGIGRYSFEILRGFHALLSRSNTDHITVRIYLPDAPVDDMPAETEFWKYAVRAPKRLWTRIGLPIALFRDFPRADVVFSPTHYVPRFSPIPRVMSVMDLSYLYFPDLFKRRDLYQLTRWTEYSIRHSTAICTISEFSKNDIINRYNVPQDIVHITYPGFSMPVSQTPLTIDQLTKTYGISNHYILSVGTVQPRKNYERLIEAFSVFLKKNRQKFGNIDLVIAGKKGWLYEPILEAPKKFGIQDRVKFLDFVKDDHLPVLYTHALCFALPSLYEGFGLPVLEAMAYKTPVVISRVSSLPEIAADAGIYVDPEDTESIADGLLKAVTQRNLIQGRTRIQKGLTQVGKFSWDTAAKQTLEILKEVGRATSE